MSCAVFSPMISCNSAANSPIQTENLQVTMNRFWCTRSNQHAYTRKEAYGVVGLIFR